MEDFRIIDLIQAEWFKDKGKSSVWIRAYKISGIMEKDLSEGKKIIELSKCNVVVIKGPLKYLKIGESDTVNIENFQNGINNFEFGEKTAPAGVYLLIVFPSKIDGVKVAEVKIKNEADQIEGLLISLYGRNILYQQIFESYYNLNGCRQVYSPVFLPPFLSPKPILDNRTEGFLRDLDTKMNNVDTNIKARISLGLRWFKSAAFDDGIDAFIKYWIVLETLAMPNTTNIKTLVNIISEYYKISKIDAKKKYKIGELFGFRSRIIHEGHLKPVHAMLLMFLEALITDVLMYIINGPKLKKAEAILNNPEFDFQKYIK